MMRPGTKVNRPAITKAPRKIATIARRCCSTACRFAFQTASGSVTRVKIASRWMGLHGPQIRSSWMKNALTLP